MLDVVDRTERIADPSEAALTAHKAAEAPPTIPAGWRQLEVLPVGLFAAVMGLTGLSVAWSLAQARYAAPAWIADVLGWAALAAFVAIAAGYAAKAAIAPQAVRAEFVHPIAGNLFGTPLISLLLLPIPLARANLLVAQVVWVLGAVGMTVFAWLIVTRWLSERQQAAHATPAWIVPVVGLLDVPLALPGLGLPPMHAVMMFGLAVGLFFAVPLFTLILSRLLFEAPLPVALQPALLILIAPFAVGFSTYVATTGTIDLFAEALYALTLFLLAVLLPKLARLVQACPFRVAWWAVSFPLAAAAVASLRIATAMPGALADGTALALLALATLVILWLLGRTLFGLARGELRTLTQ
ncbi:SLAC1 anion channel family protein [Methylobacterium sp. J-001]|uniref:SLAC1 anion channel family protein n=1 Tax=Methylobacterium sp. J-001 TaxID=2836609 RepID=UPI001FB8F2E9|nr:SLAC1 anion channel family protein [Methylobacterium sp. J-001]MCJ2115316.1 SLAC1 anion channel family protein [Methylobacterium sp. J-001]